MAQDYIEEGWSLGSDNVPPSVRAERERRFAEKRRRREMEKRLAEGMAAPAPQAAKGAYDPFDGVIEPFSSSWGTGAGRELGAPVKPAGGTPAPHSGGATAGSGVSREALASPAGETPALHSGTAALQSGAAKPQLAKTAQPWQTISGLTPDGEAKMSRSERRYAIRKLFRDFERRAREALGEHEKDSERDERTFLWTPLEAICIELGIARRKLSALTKELTGMSAQETIDCIRAEAVRETVKAKLAEKARSTYAEYFAEDEKAYRKGSVAPVWKNPNAVPPEQLEKEKQAARAFAEAGITVRPANGWSGCANRLLQRAWDERRTQPGIGWSERKNHAARQQFARELGFSSYARLYRACLLSAGKSPMELEHAAAVELFEKVDGEFEMERARVREDVLRT